MGLLNSVVSALSASSPQAQVQGKLLPALIQVVQEYPGGLGGLIQRFKQAGLEGVVASWLSKGENLPIQENDLRSVMGSSAISKLVSLSGLTEGSVLENLKVMLPSLIDQSSPNGEFDPTQEMDATSLLGGLTRLFSNKS